MLISSRYEGMPLVALESLALGTPVISLSYPGADDFIFNSKNGYVADSLKEFVDLIIKCLTNEKHRQYLSQNSRQIIKTNFSTDRAKAYCDLLANDLR